ncbi:hypothetical protein BC938DRAFT_474326 [Jimgerdemannia flammicorona]|uniref:Peptidase C14 caspase domain-containing protein n=1 Tax=Jimgerdemannia flammicorona TaxID=994334 RepID=A0A433Q2C4_9FUNG|nr:hypothetical protein BC938DRAFT_474326 [Jimgerdemannia flammicorona]
MASQDPQKQLFKNGYALVIGTGADLSGQQTDAYQSTINDARWFYDILTDDSRCAYPTDQVKLLDGPKATREAICSALEWLEEEAKAGSTVAIFFSGHARRTGIENDTCVLSCSTSNEFAGNNTISGKELYRFIHPMAAQKIILFLNCCFAGGIVPQLLTINADDDRILGLGNVPLNQVQIDKLSAGKGFAVLSSSRGNETSLTGYRRGSGKKKYSAFVVGICQALTGVGQPATDGFVYVADLALSCCEYVRRKTKGLQNPYLDFRGADNFAVAYYRAGLLNKLRLGDGDGETLEEDFEVTDDDPEDNRGAPALPAQSNVFSNSKIRASKSAVAIGGINIFSGTGNATVTWRSGS